MIQAYGEGGFRIAGQPYVGSVIVFLEETLPWSVTEPGAITLTSLAPVTESDLATSILLIGCGPVFLPPPKGLREGLRAAGVTLEWMDTSAACRTFNVLLAEERDAMAALIAVE